VKFFPVAAKLPKNLSELELTKRQFQLPESIIDMIDTRLSNDALVFGVLVNEKAKAYSVDAIRQQGEVEDTFEGTTFVLRHDQELDVVRMYKKQEDGSEERVNPISGFWFSWAAAHPDTELLQ